MEIIPHVTKINLKCAVSETLFEQTEFSAHAVAVRIRKLPHRTRPEWCLCAFTPAAGHLVSLAGTHHLGWAAGESQALLPGEGPGLQLYRQRGHEHASERRPERVREARPGNGTGGGPTAVSSAVLPVVTAGSPLPTKPQSQGTHSECSRRQSR